MAPPMTENDIDDEMKLERFKMDLKNVHEHAHEKIGHLAPPKGSEK